MPILDLSAITLTVAALFSWISHRYLRMPVTIGVMLIALLFSVSLVLMGQAGLPVDTKARVLLAGIDFNETLMHGMLSFLLFAGALHVNLDDLRQQRIVVSVLASLGVLISTLVVATLAWGVFKMVGYSVPYAYCLVFGALISPTDPIAVLAILKSAGAPKTLETKITGESLFNDGVAVVVFIVLLRIASGEGDTSPTGILGLFVLEAVGGALFGLGIGYGVYQMLKRVDSYQVEVLLTLALVMGGYSAAHALHLSGPIAIVVAGLLIGNHGRTLAMSERTREHLDTFWELLDEILNIVLFLLIGLEILILTFNSTHWLLGLVMIPVVLVSRFISVSIPVSVLKRFRSFSPGVIRVLTWAGLRGGISVALALSLPAELERDLFLTLTYVVVLFSIIVQGLTVGRVLRAVKGSE